MHKGLRLCGTLLVTKTLEDKKIASDYFAEKPKLFIINPVNNVWTKTHIFKYVFEGPLSVKMMLQCLLSILQSCI